MGFGDLFQRPRPGHGGVPAPPWPGRPGPGPGDPSLRRLSGPAPAGPARPADRPVWVAPGVAITARGLVIPDGMLYVGWSLPAAAFDGPDPALIDLRLPVAGPPDWTGSGMGYWPSYSDIPPVSRAAYLEWLAGGRRDPHAYIGYVFLFFYGLERRVLIDCANPGPARSDLPAIRAEVRRLLGLYGHNHSFRGYAQRFLELVDVYSGEWQAAAPARAAERWPVPLALRRGLGRIAAQGVPVPADWALAWAWFHPETGPRTPARRCAAEYERLFAIRYRERYGAGLPVRPNKTAVLLEYNPASAGLRFVRLDLRLPNVFQLAGPTRKLAALADECTDALDAYSRFLGREPDGGRTLPAVALLPRELIDADAGPVAKLYAWANTQLGTAGSAVVRADDLIAHWPAQARTKNGRLTKKDATALAQLLGHRGIGIEPDPRMGGALPAEGAAVLFRCAGTPAAVASGAYAAASALLHLAVAVSQADGDVADAEREHLLAHLETGLDLSDAERVRLRAHLHWLLVTGAGLTAVKRRLVGLSAGQRARIGAFLVTVAAADGVISAAEVTMLNRIYGLLELNPDDVYGALHAAAAPPAPAADPITVRPADPERTGYAIRRPPPPETTQDAGIRLDPAAVARKIAETAEVSSLLGSIFVEDDEPAPRPVPAMGPAVESVAGLDTPHSGLLRALVGKHRWTRGEFEELAAIWGVLPDGAIDAVNDAAYDTAGDPLLEGDDPIQINTDVLGEMLS